GLRIVHDPEWHTYWRNPGDSGLPTQLQWTLPENVSAGAIEWPAPHRIEVGELVNFGYDGELLLPVRISLPQDLPAGTSVPIAVDASWLVCREECIPGDAQLTLQLPTGSTAAPDPQWRDLFARAATHSVAPASWQAHWVDTGDAIDVIVDDAGELAEASAVEIFPAIATLIAHARGAVTRLDDGTLRIRTPKSDSFSAPADATQFLIASGDDAVRRVWQIAVLPAAAATTAGGAAPLAQSTTADRPGVILALALALALAGGLLLELMPRGLPVLSLKALALAEHSHDRASARRHGLLYLAGTLTCFVALAAVLLALRSAGEYLGWGFQLQSPVVVGALAVLMTVMGLSLSGMFELGSSWMGLGQQLTEGNGARSAFFSGALAAVVASPCTAPFMGPALGFALTQSAPVALAVFAALAVGLALPVVALSFLPLLARWLPKPGAWMQRFKQILAYPLYATAIWLLWVLGRQGGVDAMALALLAILAWVFGLWLWQTTPRRAISRAIAALTLIGAVALVISLRGTEPPIQGAAASHTWTRATFDELRSAGRPMLVNMTAAWCITCLANERVALLDAGVQQRLQELDIAYLKGDWTHRDDAITTYLSQFGRSGVPLYVVYPRGPGEPEVLPQLLTPAIVEAALLRAASLP
ncbi:MAG TPA: protein-disulfide reductase DsbD family protein, partial [Ottowia sp.]|nr:protein-disulfide reductase DsbD family protein [Ottowia sp.]